ncbi:ABC transporter substrate-binding protein [Anaerocolumna sp. AGMB13025]|uniref:ABC transporter substrate-binding protein n=1 Tax=Anaerocolumna sp. AGMB13025 TaxID=3039116 RepID=UPI00241D16D1|nr:ABC transporter substrate-binding protein [Anaerocolumna sp. AGMB13025]WFR60190.1 ABC transporter substrate-binding protein [Anaerocolumna sp. AGMB13025]
MMKKFSFILLFAFVGIIGLTGCQKSSKPTVYVYNWGEYIDPDVIDSFEKETGIKVEYNEFEQNEDMYPVIKTGSVKYDVVCPSDYMIQKMIDENLLAEINYDNVPNIKNIDTIYLKSAENFDPGNKYSVPYCWGTVGILYNKSMIKEPIDSWDALFDKDFIERNGYSGDILMINSVRDAFGIALSYLGYSINTTDQSQLEEAKKLLQSQFPMVDAYVVDQVRDKMIGGENPIGVIYSGEAIFTQRENKDLEYVVPKEGSNVWIDGWVIPKNAPNKEYAEKWINYMCDPEIALKNFEYITYSTPNKAARDLIKDEDIKNSKVAFPEASVLERCQTYQYLGTDLEKLYLDKWNEVKSN